MSQNLCTIWQIHDNKPGHVNQMRGLTSALTERGPVEVHELPTPSRWFSWKSLATGTFSPGRSLPAPHLILGTGHATHLAVLAARRAYGGKAIVLMKPSLPVALFDLCLVPRHDRVTNSSKVVQTLGVLNMVTSNGNRDSRRGLFLIGGPSAAHGWNDESMVGQVATIVAAAPTIAWKLTTSRRTPESFGEQLKRKGLANLTFVPHSETTSSWVPEQLAHAAQVWVSADSVSMVYESLTSGAAVGVLEVPCHRTGRVVAGIEGVLDEGWATRYTDWQQHRTLKPSPVKFDEARRCAEIVSQRFLSNEAA